MIDYSKKDIIKCLKKMHLTKGDTIYCHSSIGYFGRLLDCHSSDDLCECFFESIFEVIGDSGTLIVPTYTYSFPKNEIFNPNKSISRMGIFSEWVRRHKDSLRVVDPCYSVSVVGKNKEYFINNATVNSFGKNSVFDKFFNLNGRILCLNFPGNTFIHYIERKLNVNYRFDKIFSGLIEENGELIKAKSIIYVRFLSDDSLEHSPINYEFEGRKSGLIKSVKLGRGEMSSVSSKGVYKIIIDNIKNRPYFLTKAEVMGVSSPKIF